MISNDINQILLILKLLKEYMKSVELEMKYFQKILNRHITKYEI